MIDTLARHLAALGEARRLVAMVLANNKAFTDLQLIKAGCDIEAEARAEAAIETDPVYLAYRQLGQAIADATPHRLEPYLPTGLPAQTLTAAIGVLPSPMARLASHETASSGQAMSWSHANSRADSASQQCRSRPATPQPPGGSKPPQAIEVNANPIGSEPADQAYPTEAQVSIVYRDPGLRAAPAADRHTVQLLTILRSS